MKRIVLLVALIPSAAALAQTPGTVESFYVSITKAGVPFDAVGPLASNFILTDIVVSEVGTLIVEEVVGETVEPKLLWSIDATNREALTMTSGLRFTAGSTIRLTHNNPPSDFALCGYYDATNAGSVPAVRTWGLVALTLLIVSVGSILIRKRGVA